MSITHSGGMHQTGGNQGNKMGWISKLRNDDGGASLVEFAVLAPFLILLLLGIVELGYKFAQYNEVRHAAREGARYAAVSRPDLGAGSPEDNVVKSVCDALDLPAGSASVSLNGSETRGGYATLTVTASVSSLSGAPLITSFVPTSLENEATFRLEQDADWNTGLTGNC